MKKEKEELISLSNKVLKVLFVLLIVVGIYAALVILQQLRFLPILTTILRILMPLFIGIILAWLFHPLASWLNKKGLNRIISATICFVLFIGAMALVLSSLIPILYQQINDFVGDSLPLLFETSQNWIDGFFASFSNVEAFDVDAFRLDIFTRLESFGGDLASSLPAIIISIVTAFFSGLGTFVMGIIIGFYLLIDFDKHSNNLFAVLPIKIRDDAYKLIKACEIPLKRFVHGSLLNSTFVFVVMLIGFSIMGVQAPLLFALFAGITNIIPYIGPWIGGIPVVLVALSQSTGLGIAVLIFVVVFQMLEGSIIQTIIISKATYLNPVTIILGLLIFGHFFGIIGMVISTPIIGALKEVVIFFNNKYNILEFKRE